MSRTRAGRRSPSSAPGNWVDIAWVILGLALTAFVVFVRPEKLADVDRVYVEDETMTPEERADAFPTA